MGIRLREQRKKDFFQNLILKKEKKDNIYLVYDTGATQYATMRSVLTFNT